MKQRILVLYAGVWEITDERTGVCNTGCSVSYYLVTDLSPMNNANGTYGLRPAKCTVDPSWLNGRIPKAPAIYDAEFTYTVDSKGKPVLALADLQYVGDVFLDVLTPEAASAGKVTK